MQIGPATDFRPLVQANGILRAASARFAAQAAAVAGPQGTAAVQGAAPAPDIASAARLAAASEILRALADAPVERLAQALADLARNGVLTALFRIDPRDERLKALLGAQPPQPQPPAALQPKIPVPAPPASFGGEDRSQAALALAKEIAESIVKLSAPSARDLAPQGAGFGRQTAARIIPVMPEGFFDGAPDSPLAPVAGDFDPAGAFSSSPAATKAAPALSFFEAEAESKAPLASLAGETAPPLSSPSPVAAAVARLAPFAAPPDLPRLNAFFRALDPEGMGNERPSGRAQAPARGEKTISIPVRNAAALGPIVQELERAGFSARLEYVPAQPGDPDSPAGGKAILHLSAAPAEEAETDAMAPIRDPRTPDAKTPLPASERGRAESKPENRAKEPEKERFAKPVQRVAPQAKAHGTAAAKGEALGGAEEMRIERPDARPNGGPDVRPEGRIEGLLREIGGDRRAHESVPPAPPRDAPASAAAARYDFSVGAPIPPPAARAAKSERLAPADEPGPESEDRGEAPDPAAPIPRHRALIARIPAGLPMLLSDRAYFARASRWAVVAAEAIALPAPAALERAS